MNRVLFLLLCLSQCVLFAEPRTRIDGAVLSLESLFSSFGSLLHESNPKKWDKKLWKNSGLSTEEWEEAIQRWYEQDPKAKELAEKGREFRAGYLEEVKDKVAGILKEDHQKNPFKKTLFALEAFLRVSKAYGLALPDERDTQRIVQQKLKEEFPYSDSILANDLELNSMWAMRSKQINARVSLSEQYVRAQAPSKAKWNQWKNNTLLDISNEQARLYALAQQIVGKKAAKEVALELKDFKSKESKHFPKGIDLKRDTLLTAVYNLKQQYQALNGLKKQIESSPSERVISRLLPSLKEASANWQTNAKSPEKNSPLIKLFETPGFDKANTIELALWGKFAKKTRKGVSYFQDNDRYLRLSFSLKDIIKNSYFFEGVRRHLVKTVVTGLLLSAGTDQYLLHKKEVDQGLSDTRAYIAKAMRPPPYASKFFQNFWGKGSGMTNVAEPPLEDVFQYDKSNTPLPSTVELVDLFGEYPLRQSVKSLKINIREPKLTELKDYSTASTGTKKNLILKSKKPFAIQNGLLTIPKIDGFKLVQVEIGAEADGKFVKVLDRKIKDVEDGGYVVKQEAGDAKVPQHFTATYERVPKEELYLQDLRIDELDKVKSLSGQWREAGLIFASDLLNQKIALSEKEQTPFYPQDIADILRETTFYTQTENPKTERKIPESNILNGLDELIDSNYTCTQCRGSAEFLIRSLKHLYKDNPKVNVRLRVEIPKGPYGEFTFPYHAETEVYTNPGSAITVLDSTSKIYHPRESNKEIVPYFQDRDLFLQEVEEEKIAQNKMENLEEPGTKKEKITAIPEKELSRKIAHVRSITPTELTLSLFFNEIPTPTEKDRLPKQAALHRFESAGDRKLVQRRTYFKRVGPKPEDLAKVRESLEEIKRLSKALNENPHYRALRPQDRAAMRIPKVIFRLRDFLEGKIKQSELNEALKEIGMKGRQNAEPLATRELIKTAIEDDIGSFKKLHELSKRGEVSERFLVLASMPFIEEMQAIADSINQRDWSLPNGADCLNTLKKIRLAKTHSGYAPASR